METTDNTDNAQELHEKNEKQNIKNIVKEIVTLEEKIAFDKYTIADLYDLLKDKGVSVRNARAAIKLRVKNQKEGFEEKTTEVLDFYGEYFE